MSFQEKSAWGLLLGIGLVAYFYFPAAFRIAQSVPHGAQLIAISIAGVIALVVIEVIYHVLIAIPDGEETDERDALIDLKAERNAGFVLGIGLFTLVGHIIATHSFAGSEPVGGLVIGVWILFVLTLAEVAKLGWQIWYYRTSA